jgi:hypothetical protein
MRLLGLNREVLDKVADNQKVVAEKKEQTGIAQRPKESVRPVASAEPKVQPPEPEKSPIIASEPEKATRMPEAKKAAPPAPASVTLIRPSTTIKPLFRRLEEPVSAIASGIRQEPILLDDTDFKIRDMRLLGLRGLRPEPAGGGPGLIILPEVSGLQARASKKLATFRASGPKKIEFSWADMSPDELRAERDSLRDCILEIHSTDNRIRYCVLRDKPATLADSSEFQARLESERTARFTYTIYNWDERGLYYDKLPELQLADCFLQGAGDRNVPKLIEKQDGTWVASLDEEPLLSVGLGKVRFQKDERGLRPVLESRGEVIPVRRSARTGSEPRGNPRASDTRTRKSDEWSVILIKLYDHDPGRLSERIKRAESDVREAEAELEDKDREVREWARGEIRRLEKEIPRLKHLSLIYNSLINLKVVWKIDGLKLELAQLDASKLVPDTGHAAHPR